MTLHHGTIASIAFTLLTGCSSTRLPSGSPDASAAPATRYLLFQSFFGANAIGVSAPPPWDQAKLKSGLETYVSDIQARILPDTISLAADRRYGFSIGPLTLEQTDQDLAASIKTAFDVAIERKVAVGFHFDVTHFWRYARNANGDLLSEGTGVNDLREWQDWTGGIASQDPWDGVPTLMPYLCLECDQVKAVVDRVAGTVIGPALKAGLDRLHALDEDDLFASVIIGWEAGSFNPLEFHSLTIKGYSAATSLTDLHRAQQQVLHDYLHRWTKILGRNGIPRAKIYTHALAATQWAIDFMFPRAKMEPLLGGKQGYDDWLLRTFGVGPDAFWVLFNDDANGGTSFYPDSSHPEGIAGSFEAIAAEAAKQSIAWGEPEGTNGTGDGSLSVITWETYLARIFNHGGTMANLFGGFMGPTSAGYGQATESGEAAAAYRKFLSGGTLEESPPRVGSANP